MWQCFGIVQCFIGSFQLIIVDEFIVGLDFGECNWFYNLFLEIGENVIVIFFIYIVQDVKELCINMVIINEGYFFFIGVFDVVFLEMSGKVWEKLVFKVDLDCYKVEYQVIFFKFVAGQFFIYVYSEVVLGDGFEVVDFSLEDVFFGKIFGVN